MNPIYGYLAGTFDFLHIGHINFINEAKKKCDRLIVGVMTDECVEKYKGRRPIMKFDDRVKMVYALKQVFSVLKQDTFEFPHSLFRMKEFHGDKFIIFDSVEHKREGADVILNRTEGISSSMKREVLNATKRKN